MTSPGITAVAYAFDRSIRPEGPRWAPALELLRASFPETLLPEARLRTLVAGGRYSVRAAMSPSGDALAGVAVVADLPGARACHLDYLATDPAHRRTGVATALFRDALGAAGPERDLLTLEVDESLVDFYRRRGARLLAAVKYLFPSEPPIPMLLMVAPAGTSPPLGPTLARSRVRAFVTALYSDVHGRGPADPLLESVLGDLARLPPDVPLE